MATKNNSFFNLFVKYKNKAPKPNTIKISERKASALKMAFRAISICAIISIITGRTCASGLPACTACLTICSSSPLAVKELNISGINQLIKQKPPTILTEIIKIFFKLISFLIRFNFILSSQFLIFITSLMANIASKGSVSSAITIIMATALNLL